ncbi:MAG: ABC transporter substrate-binding protein [Anaerolineaceae bacterium]|nr:ABC transporter substrate-binding protein [Anaerolineaceae bacterium]
MKKTIVLLLSLVMVIGIFAGCAGNPTTTPTDGTTTATTTGSTTGTAENPDVTESETPMKIIWNHGIGIDTLFENPQKDNTLMLASKMIWESAAIWDANKGEYILTIAKEYGSNDDYTEFWVTFNDGITWHDGQPVTVEDLYFSLHAAILNPNSPASGGFKDIIGFQDAKDGITETVTGISVADGKLTVKLAEGQWNWISKILGLDLLPAHLFEGVAWADMDSSDYFKKPIGCGPYVINEVNFPDYFTLTRFDGYHGEPAGIKNVQAIHLSGEATVAAVMAGSIDFANRTTVTSKEVADSIELINKDVTTYAMPSYGTRCFFFNLGDRKDGAVKDDLQKKEVRQAFDILMDEIQIAAMNQGTPSGTLVNPVSLEYNANCSRPYDVAAAKALLDSAGFDYNNVYDFAYYYNEEVTHNAFALIKQLFAAAGVQVNPILMEGNLADLIYVSKNYDLLMLMASADGILMAKTYQQMESTTSYTFMGLHEERGAIFDPLMAEYRSNTDAAKRKEIALKLQELNFEHCYALSGYMYTNYVGVNTARISVPEEVFAVDGNWNYQWHNWKILD